MYRHFQLFDALAMAIAFGLIHNLIITLPPQHGKSEFWSRYFTAWYLGVFPDNRVVLSSYEAGFAASWGEKARRVIEDHGPDIFQVGVSQSTHAKDDWSIEGHEGGMVTAGVGGALTGRGADLGIVDDPIKNAEEAFSKAHKDKIMDWWDSTFCSRIHDSGVKIVMATRWAEDDLVGRLIKLAKAGKEKWVIIELPAIAEKNEKITVGEYTWTRKKGEVLCPQLYSLKTMIERKGKTSTYWWETLYQGKPFSRDGGHLKPEWFAAIDDVPTAYLKCRAWDLAASESPTAKRTAGTLMVRSVKDDYCVANVVFGRWSPGKRNRFIKRIAELDGRDVPIVIEQEGGSGGIAQVDELIRLLDGWTVYRVSAATGGSKVLRVDAMAGQAELGRITLRRAPWNEEFRGEAKTFPGGKTIDIIDAAAHGYNWLAAQDPPTEIPENYDPTKGADERGLFNQGIGAGRVF